MVGHFNSMLEVGQLLKCLGEVSDAGDLGQRMRLIWKQACLVDQHAGTYVGSRVCRSCRSIARRGGLGMPCSRTLACVSPR